jgi:hypothetical protein
MLPVGPTEFLAGSVMETPRLAAAKDGVPGVDEAVGD